MCRLTICGPESRVELAVPTHVPIADLMPAVLGHLDPALATTGLGHDGWVLQRLGEPPLNEDEGTAAAGLYDGDLLYLRPRDDQLPLADFDDLVDGVHTGLSGKPDRWRPVLTERTCTVVAALAAVLAVYLASLGASGVSAAIGAGLLGVLLLGAAVLLGSVVGDDGSAVAIASAGVLALGAAGMALPSGTGPPVWFTAPGVLAASVAVALAATVVRMTSARNKHGFLAVAGGAVLVGLGATLDVLAGLGGPATAAVLVPITLALTRFAPRLAAVLGGLAAQPVPTTPEGFQEGLDPLPSKEVLDKATVADRHVTAFITVLGVVNAGALLVVSSVARWDTVTLTVVVALLLLLQARELAGVWHRLAAFVPAVLVLVALVVEWAGSLPLVARAGVVIGLLALAGLAVAGKQMLPGRRLVPRWGWVGDLLQWLCALGIVPVVLSITGAYAWVATLL